MPRSCVISRIESPSSRLSEASSRRICACTVDVERGGRLVGDQQLGIAHQRHRDHHALAQAARELMGKLAEPHVRRRDADAPISSTARSSAAAREAPLWRVSTSAICEPTVKAGLRLVIGSWKIIDMRLPRMRAMLAIGQRHQIDAAERHALCRAMTAAGKQLMTASAVTDLPQPDSPT
jgi:hypothetical protein